MEYKMVSAGTRKEGDQGVMEDSEELLKALDAKVKDAVRLGWRVVGDVVTGPDGRLNQTMVRVRRGQAGALPDAPRGAIRSSANL